MMKRERLPYGGFMVGKSKLASSNILYNIIYSKLAHYLPYYTPTSDDSESTTVV